MMLTTSEILFFGERISSTLLSYLMMLHSPGWVSLLISAVSLIAIVAIAPLGLSPKVTRLRINDLGPFLRHHSPRASCGCVGIRLMSAQCDTCLRYHLHTHPSLNLSKTPGKLLMTSRPLAQNSLSM